MISFDIDSHEAPDDGDIVWTTREGQRLRLHEIGDRHLLNIIAHLKQRAMDHLNQGYSALSFLQGEMALDAAQSDIDMEQRELKDLVAFFESEARKRKLIR